MARRSRRKTREDRATRGNLLGLLLIATLIVVLTGSSYIFWIQKQHHRALDPVTQCPKEPQDTDSITALLVDMTDEMTTVQKKDFQNQLEEVRNGIPQYGRLEIFVVDSTSQSLLTPIVSLCNPGRGQSVDPLFGNPEKIEKRWETSFRVPLDKAFDKLFNLKGAQSSPILESIQSVALTSFQPADRAGRPNKLIVASDLLQFTQGINFYKGLPTLNSLLDSPAFGLVRTDLQGVKVELWMLQRAELAHLQTRSLAQTLWGGVLTEQGAQLVRIYRVSG